MMRNLSLKQKKLGLIVCLALGLVFIEILSLILVSGYKSFDEAYLNLCQWDCIAFARIAKAGYLPSTSIPPVPYSDWGHFPGLPLAVRAFKSLFDPFDTLSWLKFTVFTSQIFTWGFWIYLLLIAEEILNISRLGRWLLVLMILSYPQFFFVISGYSESMFLFGLVGLIYWSQKTKNASLLLAGFHGILMSQSRMVGLPLAVLPIGSVLLAKNSVVSFSNLQTLIRPMAIAVIASLGTLSYFLFCYYQYGHWDLYFLSIKSGWQMSADYLFFFKGSHYHLKFPSVDDDYTMNYMGYLVITFTLGLLALVEGFIFFREKEIYNRQRILFYFATFILWFTSAAGAANLDMQSMNRYGICMTVTALLGFIPQLERLDKKPSRYRQVWLWIVMLIVAIGFVLQGQFAHRYVHGQWVS